MKEQTINILIIEKDEFWAEQIREVFKARPDHFRLTVTDNITEAQNIMLKSSPDLVITSLPLPAEKDLQLLMYEGKRSFSPLVVLVNQDDEALAIEAIERGALDHVVKSKETIADLPRIVERALREWQHIFERMQTEEALEIAINKLSIKSTELVDATAKLEILSMTDELTGLYNRKYVSRTLEKELARAVRYDRNLALLLLEVDRFDQSAEKIDETGRRIIITDMADLLKASIRNADQLARYGQADFAIILPEIDIHEAFEVAEKLRRIVEDHTFSYRGQPVELTVSVGVTAHSRTNHESWEQIIDTANKALASAQKSGVNRVVAQR